jgi:hypothetical protein
MTEQTNKRKSGQVLRDNIIAAFPGSVFSGPITRVDGRTDEALEEEQALYNALRARKWSDIEGSFVSSNVDGIALLTDQAFAAFLPAWLIAALDENEVREMLVYFFSPSAHEPSESRDRRIEQLTLPQKKVLRAFLTYCFEVEDSEFVKEHARSAAEYTARFVVD